MGNRQEPAVRLAPVGGSALTAAAAARTATAQHISYYGKLVILQHIRHYAAAARTATAQHISYYGKLIVTAF